MGDRLDTMAEADTHQQVQSTERHTSENYSPTHTPTSTVTPYIDLQPAQMEIPGSTTEITPLAGRHLMPQLLPERPLVAIAQPRRTAFNLFQDPAAGTSTLPEARMAPPRPGVSPMRNMFSPASPDAEEDRGLHRIEPIRPAPQGRQARRLAQPLQNEFTTEDVGKLNEVLPQPLDTYPSRRDAETAISNLPQCVNRTLLTHLSPQAQDMIIKIRRNALVRKRTLRAAQLQRENEHLNTCMTRLQNTATGQQAEIMRLRVMVDQLQHQKGVLLKFCNEKLQQQRAALAMFNTGMTTVGNSHHPDNDQRKTNPSAQ
ncbi:uncharacterized protein LOC115590547 isoform X2 [Sparus aurata]|uniref:uncharacterized protein LOC115590547 isoform X2 n=1 Tax=Sparus aurata TaxID=8175 RepID=UPI0011C1A12F|nr:uncharacterized protein LOC115590547 isoform X2 [Sparus aurata]